MFTVVVEGVTALNAVCTSDALHEAALMVCATATESVLKRSPKSCDFIILVILNPRRKTEFPQ
jgi:hypothetical protein